MSKRYCLISHTHWDREWYIPFENFRMRLVDLIDHLLEILDEDPEYRFHLDAQTIVLDDYLAIRPSKKEILKDHIKNGRILVGPWYVQNDFHLTDGEATVRNLIIGTTMANEFGASMPIGYAADQFGLVSQLPQILAKSGLRDCVFGRGFDRGVSEFFWESEDGSKVLCEHMRFWYNNAQRLSPVPEGALELVRQRGAACASVCSTGNYLLMNGVDHLEAQEDLTEIMNKVRPMLNDDEEIFQDTLPEFMQRVRREVEENGIELKTFRGEFRDNGADNVLTGTLSSRIYLKQANVSAQVELERQVEPLYSLLSAAGIKDYPHDYLWYIWKLLIENHPHDSICGCSADAVHEHMMDRFARVHENASDLFSRGIDDLNAHIDANTVKADGEYRVILLNGTGTSSADTNKVVIDIMASEDKGGFELYDENGAKVEFIVNEIQKDVGRRILSPINLPGESRVNRYFVTLDAGITEGYTYRVLTVKLTDTPLAAAENSADKADVLENAFIKAEIMPDGSVKLTDKRSGKVHEGLLVLEDLPDRGNLYNYIPGAPEGAVCSKGVKAEITNVESTPMRQSRRIAYTLDVDREESAGKIGVEMTLSLDKNSDVLDVQMKIHNELEYHRLRVLVPTDIKAETNYASQPYDIIVRNKVSQYHNDKEHPSMDFVGVEDENGGIALLHHGLYEYEQMTDDRNTIALTVLRAVGRITGGWEERNTMTQTWITPGGHCIGDNTAHFALVPYTGDHVKAQIAAKAQLFLSPVYAFSRAVDPNKFVGGRPFVQGPGMPDLFYRPIERADKTLPVSGTFVKVESADNAVVVTAVKQAQSGEGYIVRLYNTTSDDIDLTLTSPLFGVRSAQIVSMLEDNVFEDVKVCCGKVKLTAKPKEIITLLLK